MGILKGLAVMKYSSGFVSFPRDRTADDQLRELDPECSIPVVRDKHLIKPIRCLLWTLLGLVVKIFLIFRAPTENGYQVATKVEERHF